MKREKRIDGKRLKVGSKVRLRTQSEYTKVGETAPVEGRAFFGKDVTISRVINEGKFNIEEVPGIDFYLFDFADIYMISSEEYCEENFKSKRKVKVKGA